MAQNKKDFMAEAAGVFVDKMITPAATPQPAAKPVAIKKPQTNAAGTEIKVCFMLAEEIERKMRYIAFAERCKQKTIVTDALLSYINNYEAAHGKIK